MKPCCKVLPLILHLNSVKVPNTLSGKVRREEGKVWSS